MCVCVCVCVVEGLGGGIAYAQFLTKDKINVVVVKWDTRI